MLVSWRAAASTSGSVNVAPRFMMTSAARNSFHDVMKANSATVTIAGLIAGPDECLPAVASVDDRCLFQLFWHRSKLLRMT